MNTNLQTLNPEPLNSELIIGPTYADYADACRYSLPWSVNALAQLAVHYLMEHKAEVNSFIDRTRELIEKEKKRFTEKQGIKFNAYRKAVESELAVA